MRKRAILLGIAGAFALSVCGWFGYRYVARPIFYSVTKLPHVKSRFGFDYGTPYVGDAHCSHEVLSIPYVRPGGPFALAGIRDGDIVTPGSHRGITDLCIRLDALAPGDSIVLQVRTPEEIGCWADWPERSAVVAAP